MVFGYVFLAQIDINPLTQNLGFNILFHPYIDHDLDQAICTVTCGVNSMYLGYGKKATFRSI